MKTKRIRFTPSSIENARGNVTLPLESPPERGNLNRQRCKKQCGGNPEDYDDPNGYTPLTKALNDHNFEEATQLINEGADVNQKDSKGIPPSISLIFTLENYFNEKTEKEINDIKAKVMNLMKLMREKKADFNATDKYGATCLHHIVDFDMNGGNHKDIIKELIDNYGADPDFENNYNRTPLTIAEENENIEMMKLLLSKSNKMKSFDEELSNKLTEWMKDKPTEISAMCDKEHNDCPITAIDLQELFEKKRLIKLEGRCYAVYAFINDIKISKNPFTREEWTEDSKTKIDFIRNFIPLLQYEFKILQHENSSLGGSIQGSKTVRRSFGSNGNTKAERNDARRISRGIRHTKRRKIKTRKNRHSKII